MGEKVARVPRVNGAVFTISGIMALALIGDSLLYSILPIYAEDLGIPLVMVGAILSINRWIRLVANPLAVKTYRQRALSSPLLFSTAGAVISTALYAFPLGTFSFLVARMLWGVSYSFFRLGSYLIVLQTSRPVLGLAMGITQAVSRLGSAFTVVAGGIIIDALGYQTGMLMVASLSALAFPLLFLLRSQLKDHGDPTSMEEEEVKHRVAQHRTLSAPYCQVAGFVTYIVGNGLVTSSLSLLLQQRVGDSLSLGRFTLGIATLAGLVFSSRWLSGLIISPVAGHLGDRFGRRLPFVLATILQAIALMVLAIWSSPISTIICTVLYFIFQNSQKVFLDTAIGDSAHGPEQNQVIGRYNSLQDLGAALGPLVGYGVGAILGFESVYVAAALALFCLGVFAFPHLRAVKGGELSN